LKLHPACGWPGGSRETRLLFGGQYKGAQEPLDLRASALTLPRNLSEEQVVYNNLDINLVIPAKAGIQERHLEATLSGFPPSRE